MMDPMTVRSTYEDTATRLRDATRSAALARGVRPVLLIDGRAGSGKSTLADEVVAVWPEAALVRLDEIYPGWDGLDAGSAAVATDVLGPPSAYSRWDWASSAPGERRQVPATGPIIIEGVGALSRASRPLAAYAVWLELDAATRRMRALGRDGDTFAPHWERWAAQEEALRRRERPEHLADEVLRPRG